MYKSLTALAAATLLFAGCASVPMESREASSKAKSFAPPAEGHAGLYIYRSGSFGGALKKDIWIDGHCLGESAPNIFFYEEVAGGVEHTLSTESEFSPNDLKLTTESGKLYFVEQYIKLGVFVGGANLELVGEDKGKKEVMNLELAAKGTCSK